MVSSAVSHEQTSSRKTGPLSRFIRSALDILVNDMLGFGNLNILVMHRPSIGYLTIHAHAPDNASPTLS